MIFLDLLYFLSLSLSVTVMWGFSKIFGPIRNFISRIPYIRRPLLCPECSSFWFGLFVSFLYNPIFLNLDFLFISNIFCGLVSHLFAHFLFTYSKKNIENGIDFIK